MSEWNAISEEASIVLVGSFNPKIFHPEWFIRKGIVEEWDYGNDEVINLPDMSQMTFPDDRKLSVLLNQFSLRTGLASGQLALKDFVTSTFSLLRETPIVQMGMNLTSIIEIGTKDNWVQFGSGLAPKEVWKESVDYISDLGDEKQEELGLWDMTMNLPRPDDLIGYVRPRITAIAPASNQRLSFSINNHIEIKESSALTMVKILEEQWEGSLEIAKSLTSKIMASQIGGSV